MMRPQFAREQVSDLEMTERHVQNMMRALEVELGPDKWTTKIVDLQVLFFRLTLDSATEFLFGESVDSQLRLASGYKNEMNQSAAPLSADFAEAFDRGQRALATRFQFGDLYYLCNPKGFKEACKTCHDFIDHFVRLALSKELQEEKLEQESSGVKEKVSRSGCYTAFSRAFFPSSPTLAYFGRSSTNRLKPTVRVPQGVGHENARSYRATLPALEHFARWT